MPRHAATHAARVHVGTPTGSRPRRFVTNRTNNHNTKGACATVPAAQLAVAVKPLRFLYMEGLVPRESPEGLGDIGSDIGGIIPP